MLKLLSPKFITKIDSHLLVNHPDIWMSKIHYVGWNGLLLFACSALLGLFLPIHLIRDVQYELWYFLLSLLSVIVMCFWIYHYAIFNKEKNFGNFHLADEYRNFILVFISVLIFLLVPVPFELVQNKRIATMYTDAEVIADMNSLNEIDPYMVHSSNNYFTWYDSTSNIQYATIKKLNPNSQTFYTPYFLRGDSVKFPALKTEYQLYKSYHPITSLSELTPKIEQYISIAEKYGVQASFTAEEVAKKYLEMLGKEKIPVSEMYGYGSYQYELMTVFSNLSKAKFDKLFIYSSDYRWTIFYFTICITSFLLLFKMTYWKQFLITIVILLLYPLITFILSQLLPYGGPFRSGSFYEGCIVALMLFSTFTLVFTSSRNKTYHAFYNIFNQISYVTLIFLFLMVLTFLHDCTNLFHNHDREIFTNPYAMPEALPAKMDYDAWLQSYYNEYWSAVYKNWVTAMKYTGIALYLILLPFYKKLFVKQISLPQRT